MSDFGRKSECEECGRDIGLITDLIRYHKDPDTESKCPGSGKLPKPQPTEEKEQK